MRVPFNEVSNSSLIEANDLIKLLLTADLENMNQMSVDEWHRIVVEFTEQLKAGVTDVDFLRMFEVAVEKEMAKRGLNSAGASSQMN